MGLRDIIDEAVLMWLTTPVEGPDEQQTYIRGYPLAGNMGCGGDRTWYSGQYILINLNDRIEMNGVVSLIHISRIGYVCALEKNGKFLLSKTPILITNLLDLWCAKWSLDINPTEVGRDLLTNGDPFLPIWNKTTWFGIFSERTNEVIAFGLPGNKGPVAGDEISLSDREDVLGIVSSAWS